jgi:hypothetical protein
MSPASCEPSMSVMLRPSSAAELIADVDGVVVELQKEKPNKGKLLRWFGGIGEVVQTAASLQPAYEALKALARALGLPL